MNINFNVSLNLTDYAPLPTFNERALMGVIIYGCVFVVSAVGNLAVFIGVFRSTRRKSRITLLIVHLTIADLIVTFLLIPLEIIWRFTVQWLAGNLGCKFLLFLRAFGLYLSSNVLICISLDRYFAILHPLSVNNARSRGKTLLLCAWIASVIFALPQVYIFHTATHPIYADFTQCVSFDTFSNPNFETVYNFLCVVFMYFLPLGVIVVTYPAIWWEIRRKAAEDTGDWRQNSRLRRSDDHPMERAKIRTLRMTIMIVVVFVVCWTPYAVITLWYMFSRSTAERIQPLLQEALFMMATANSCMNPIVYGSYAVDCPSNCWNQIFRSSPSTSTFQRVVASNNSRKTSGSRVRSQNSFPLTSRAVTNQRDTATLLSKISGPPEKPHPVEQFLRDNSSPQHQKSAPSSSPPLPPLIHYEC